MYEGVAAADFLQENSLSGVVEKADVVPGNAALAKEHESRFEHLRASIFEKKLLDNAQDSDRLPKTFCQTLLKPAVE